MTGSTPRTRLQLVLTAAATATAGLALAMTPIASPPAARALDNTPWVLPSTPPRCSVLRAEAGDVAGCLLAFYEDPADTGWGLPPAPGVGEGWYWNGYRYNGSAALAGWESSYIAANTEPVGGLRSGTLMTHVAVRALFEGFLDEIAANGYRVRDASGYNFRCTSGNGGWSCPSGDPGDLSNHAWGLAIDINSGTNPIRSYSSIDGVTACMTPIQTDLPQSVIQTAEKWGLYWGGYGWNAGCQSTTTERTTVYRDPPHFEFRGTPRQAAAIAEFNLRNDPSVTCRTVVDDAGREVERCNRSGRPEAGWRLPVQLDPPEGAVAAMINLTATEAEAAGFLTLEDCGARSGQRSTSALTYAAGQSVASMAIVPISDDGRFCVFRSTPVHSIVDVSAYLGSQSEPMWFEPVTPTRLTDTRRDGTCEPGQGCRPGAVPARARHAVPTESPDARIVNLTVVDSVAPGWLQVGRCADVGPEARFSNLNVAGPEARANLALVPAGDSGTCAFTLSEGHVVVDELGRLTGADEPGSGFGWKLAPSRRAIDTRECASQWCGGRPGAGAIVRVDLGTTAPAAAIAVTVTQTAAPGYVTVGRCSDLEEGGGTATSNVNYRAGDTTTGLAMVSLEAGAMCAYTMSPAHVVIDVQAELTVEHAVGLLPVTPRRFHDSRQT